MATSNQTSRQSGTSIFGATKPSGFGFGGTQPQTSIFGQASTSNATGTSFFGQQTTGNSSIFGATATPAFGVAAPGAGGTALAKYQPSIGTDTLMKNGQLSSVSTKQHCITAMKEYEEKSLEELRMEDYVASRKGPQAGAVGGIFGNQAPASNLFGAPAKQQTTGLFGQQPENKGLFGNTNTMAGFGQASAFGATTSQPSAGGLFNKPFAAPTTSTSNFGFGNTANNASTNMFGAKPFGAPATGSVFGAGQTNTAAPSAFGQPNTGFGGFGQPNANQNTSLFGGTQDKPAFGMAATSTGFGFGTNTNTMSGGSLFQPKPTTGFGATSGGFGTTTSMAPGFGGFGQTNPGGSLFNSSFNKPATSGFGSFGNPTVSSQPLGLGTSTVGGGLFGGAANKPGGFFGGGTGTGTGGGLFNNSLSFGYNNSLMGGLNSLNQSSLGMRGSPGLGQNQQDTVPVREQILALTTACYLSLQLVIETLNNFSF
ncbi:nuclear pore complex protein Nup98-Nup96-like [Phlebotomus papatasi]|uniref:nuclear pore complex protein Nup98-Nup96-like n=1 Tax=Phlebotomus papatasi TaxID=29031 RepID=UPI002483F6B2|nr:nuclear pore complex protein Nup98-Nup96-like [Phlebotomus papatasi]XP_055697845.1 nuclear pore complex protein Nup98-Nup96-like [Phlebotomus papatasi]XP_055697846.1 nuclear pore complex protein Nup98-Nup96-like [Phlebotomus papatasi]